MLAAATKRQRKNVLYRSKLFARYIAQGFNIAKRLLENRDTLFAFHPSLIVLAGG
jgi:hypothetical protein